MVALVRTGVLYWGCGWGLHPPHLVAHADPVRAFGWLGLNWGGLSAFPLSPSWHARRGFFLPAAGLPVLKVAGAGALAVGEGLFALPGGGAVGDLQRGDKAGEAGLLV